MHQIKFSRIAYLICCHAHCPRSDEDGLPSGEAELHPNGVEQSQFFYGQRNDRHQLGPVIDFS